MPVVIEFKKLAVIRIAEIWDFGKDSEYLLKNYDIIYFRNSRINFRQLLTPVVNGCCALDDLSFLSRCSSKFQYEVRRAEKENITVEFNPFISEIEYNQYRLFSVDKGFPAIGLSMFKRYSAVDRLVVGKAIFQGEVAQINFYLRLDDSLVFLAGFPVGGVSTAIRGWANRYLHFKAMSMAVKQGLNVYDLLGMGSFAGFSETIVRFKEEMGPVRVSRFDGVCYRSFLGRVIQLTLSLRNWLRKICV
jgi:hypothetical protein